MESLDLPVLIRCFPAPASSSWGFILRRSPPWFCWRWRRPRKPTWAPRREPSTCCFRSPGDVTGQVGDQLVMAWLVMTVSYWFRIIYCRWLLVIWKIMTCHIDSESPGWLQSWLGESHNDWRLWRHGYQEDDGIPTPSLAEQPGIHGSHFVCSCCSGSSHHQPLIIIHHWWSSIIYHHQPPFIIIT